MFQTTRCATAFASAILTFVLPSAAQVAGAPFDLQGFIDARIAKGEKTVTVPPGRYRVTPAGGHHLILRKLSRVRIIADRVEMICTETTRALTITDCSDVTVRGLTIDYDPLPFTQGRIVALSPDKSVHEVELFDGYPRAATVRSFKYEIFRPDTRTLRCEDDRVDRIETVSPSRIRIHTGTSRANEMVQVGDIVAIGSEDAPHGSIPHAVEVADCKGVRLESVTVYGSNCFGFLETNCDGTTYYRCKIDRRAASADPVKRGDPRVRSLNADAFHSICAVKGPSYIECSARFMGDDCINICGEYHLVTASAGRVLRVLSKQGATINIAPGDSVELLSYFGERLPDARVARVEPDAPVTEAEKAWLPKQGMDAYLKQFLATTHAFRVALDREVNLPMGSAICSTHRTGNGFLVKGCDFGFNRSRGILVKASDGVITGNRITGGWMAAILVSPEWWWLESGSSNNVRIEGNIIRDCRDVAIQVMAFGGAPGVAPAGAHNHISITGNRVDDSPWPGVLVTSTKDLRLAGNRIGPAGGRKAVEWTLWRCGLQQAKLEPVMTVNCEERPPRAEPGR